MGLVVGYVPVGFRWFLCGELRKGCVWGGLFDLTTDAALVVTSGWCAWRGNIKWSLLQC